MKDIRVNVLIGRFQPFTNGHMKCVEEAYSQGLPTVVVQIATKKTDRRHPFDDQLMSEVMENIMHTDKRIVDYITSKNADIVAIGEVLRGKGYSIASWTCGSDRIDAYTNMSTRYHDKAGLTDDFKMIEVKRSDEDISATKVRDAIQKDDRHTFDKLTPIGVHDFYERLRSAILLQENRIVSLSDYTLEHILS